MDVKEYTTRSLGEEMVLAEKHLTDYLQEMDKPDVDKSSETTEFCLECLSKHALAISGYAKEGTQFFEGDSYFSKVAILGSEIYNKIVDFHKDDALNFYNKLRELRKELVAKHIILDNTKIKDKSLCPAGGCHLTDTT